jgi:hypothetical protein
MIVLEILWNVKKYFMHENIGQGGVGIMDGGKDALRRLSLPRNSALRFPAPPENHSVGAELEQTYPYPERYGFVERHDCIYSLQ